MSVSPGIAGARAAESKLRADGPQGLSVANELRWFGWLNSP
ncbi:MAG: hypothetical protein ABSF57_12160 [Acidobacteriaceae bacterium]